jgi:hypothetical protein
MPRPEYSYSCGSITVLTNTDGSLASVDCSQAGVGSYIIHDGEEPIAAVMRAHSEFCACVALALADARFGCAVDGAVRYPGASCTN